MFGVKSRQKGNLLSYVPLKVANSKRHALYDSGATASLIDINVIKELKLSKQVVSGATYALSGAFEGSKVDPYGEITLSFFINKQRYEHDFIIADLSQGNEIILGEDFWHQHNTLMINKYGYKALWLNGHKVPLVTSRLVADEDHTVKAVPYLQDQSKFVNREISLFKKQFLPPRCRQVVKLRLPDEAPGQSLMFENASHKEIDFMEQVSLVRIAQTPNQHLRAGCQVEKCSGCKPYKFALIEIVNNSNKGLKLTAKKPIALASEYTKATNAEYKESLKESINMATITEPDYDNQDRIAQICKLLRDKVPDAPGQLAFMNSIAADFARTFHLENEKLSVTDILQHHISYDSDIPLWVRQRPIPHNKLPGTLKALDKLTLHGSVGPSDSPYNFQTVPVYKASNDPDNPDERSVRVTVDLSPLNRLTNRDRVSIPTWDEIMSKLHGAKVFSKIDLKSAFHQIMLNERSQRKTAFSVGSRRYQFLTCPQGLANSPATLVRLMNLVLGPCDAFCIPYMDDILVFSKDIKSHEEHLRRVFSCLSNAKLQIALDKSIFFSTAVDFLGFIVSEEGVRPEPSKLDPLLKPGKTPETLYDIRSLLGSFNVYRKHIPYYAETIKPIVDLTKGHPVAKGRNVRIKWTTEAQEALEKLKETAGKHAILTYPDFSKEFLIVSDASDSSIGGAILQQCEGSLKPISFYSKVLTPAQQRYCVTDKEALAIFSILDANKSWLLGQQICILTDHKPLKFILTSNSENPRLIRWRYLLQEFNPKLNYLPGAENSLADYLSRSAWAGPSNTIMPMQDRFIAATEDTCLPIGVPETFCPPTINVTSKTLRLFKDLKGPIVVLCDTRSPEPSGPVNTLASQLPYLREHFEQRKPDTKAFCTRETAATLGTCEKVADPTGVGPNVYLCYNVLSHLILVNDKEDLQYIRDLATPDLRAELTHNTAAERAFYAQLGLEQLLYAWGTEPPSADVYIVQCTEPRDSGKDKIAKVLRRFAYGCYRKDIQPTMLYGRGFRVKSANGDECPIVNTIGLYDKEAQIKDIVNKAKMTHDYPWTPEYMSDAQGTDPCIEALKRLLLGQEGKSEDSDLLLGLPLDQFLVSHDGLVYRRARSPLKGTVMQLFVPKSARPLALDFCHSHLGLHPGITKTAYLVSSFFFWPTAYKDTVDFVNTCLTCQKIKPKRVDNTIHGSTFLPILPYDAITIDLLTPGKKTRSGCKYVLTVVDIVSRYAWFIPTRSREAAHIADLLVSRIFTHFGYPRTVSSDNAAEFTGKVFTDVLKQLEIRHHKVLKYNPRSQGVVERCNRTLLQLLRAVYLDFPVQWDKALPMCQLAYNLSYHKSINTTPYFSFFYRDGHLPYSILYPAEPHVDSDLASRVKEAQRVLELTRNAIANTQQSRLQNVNIGKKEEVEVGDLVFGKAVHINTKDYKILPGWIGPFRVLSLKGNSAMVKSLRTGRTSCVSLRNVKLLHHSALTKRDHPSVDEPFPVHGNNDFPNDFPHVEIKSHREAVDFPSLPDLEVEVPNDKVSEGALSDAIAVRTQPCVLSDTADVLGRGSRAQDRAALERAPKPQSEMNTNGTQVKPISSRTRSKTPSINALYCNSYVLEDKMATVKDKCFLHIALP